MRDAEPKFTIQETVSVCSGLSGSCALLTKLKFILQCFRVFMSACDTLIPPPVSSRGVRQPPGQSSGESMWTQPVGPQGTCKRKVAELRA